MAVRNVLILFKPEITLQDQSALAMRIHLMWGGDSGVSTDDYIDRMIASGDLGDCGDTWIASLNRSDLIIAIETENMLTTEVGYEIELEYAMMDGAQRPSIRFENEDDRALAAHFCTEVSTSTTCTISIEGVPDADGDHTLLSMVTGLATGYLNLSKKRLTIIPSWHGHEAFLDPDRLSEYID